MKTTEPLTTSIVACVKFNPPACSSINFHLHSALLNKTLHALDTLSVIVREDITYVEVVKDLMQDLLREVDSTVNSLSAGRIPTYLVSLDLVERILESATTTIVQPSQIHLAFSLGSAIPISVDPQNLEIGFRNSKRNWTHSFSFQKERLR